MNKLIKGVFKAQNRDGRTHSNGKTECRVRENFSQNQLNQHFMDKLNKGHLNAQNHRSVHSAWGTGCDTQVSTKHYLPKQGNLVMLASTKNNTNNFNFNPKKNNLT